jgi:hypothetical protein
VEDLHGQVRFEADQVYVEGLTGKHGPASITVNGQVDRSTWWAGVSVDIEGEPVPLDDQLHEALSEYYRAIWQRFNPAGAARVAVHLRRPGVNEGEPDPQWQTRVTADLLDAKVAFDEYPYPLEKVGGRLEIEPDRIRFDGLTGRREEATVRIDGQAVFEAAGVASLDLQLQAARLRLDETLAKALPPEGQAAFAQFQPQGYADVLGTVSQPGPGRALVYDLRTKIYEAALSYQDFPYSVTDVAGEVAVRPEAITVLSATGRHGQAKVEAQGTVRRLEDGYAADLTFDWSPVLMDQELYESLPEALKDVWEVLEPAGSANLKTSFHYLVQSTGTLKGHRTEITPVDARVRFRGFPCPVILNTGKVLVTGDQVEFQALGGQAAGGKVEINGEMDFSPPGARGTLTIDADGLTPMPELISSMPVRLREALESAKPSGKFDLRMDPLRFDLTEEGRGRWDFAGELRLSDARLDLGFDLQQVCGTVSGQGGVDETGAIMVDARADLPKIVLAGWPLENASARLTTATGTPAVLVQDGAAGLYGGELVGVAEVQLGSRHAEYRASITARDLQLERYLESARSRPADDPRSHSAAQGTVYGNLFLRGQTGKSGYREGVGEIFVREAQVWKLPVVFAIFQVLNLSPDENVFHDGWLKYYLSGETLTFQQIDLQGKAMSFIGGGRMDMRTRQLDVRLLAGSPVRVRLPVLTDLLEGASREVAEVHVTGTLQHPAISPQPLRGLTTALKTLFPEPPPVHLRD